MQELKELIQKADSYKEKRLTNSFSVEEQNKTNELLKIKFIYNSNAINENSLTLFETTKILTTNSVTIPSQKDYKEVLGHSAAYDYMLSLSQQDELIITRENILKLHVLLYGEIEAQSAGTIRTTVVVPKESNYVVPSPDELDHLMNHLADQLDSSKYALHPIELAALAHKRLLDIYPFPSGNGQVARLLMNLILIHAGYGITIIPCEKKEDYFKALATSRKLYNPDPITKLIAECIVNTNATYFEHLNQ
ncbi:MAG: Fic family protein [Candidatus Galacturonibacter soehngenii]|nr:Fic family protein [Candidatus Galacturonibacter soehngenii]